MSSRMLLGRINIVAEWQLTNSQPLRCCTNTNSQASIGLPPSPEVHALFSLSLVFISRQEPHAFLLQVSAPTFPLIHDSESTTIHIYSPKAFSALTSGVRTLFTSGCIIYPIYETSLDQLLPSVQHPRHFSDKITCIASINIEPHPQVSCARVKGASQRSTKAARLLTVWVGTAHKELITARILLMFAGNFHHDLVDATFVYATVLIYPVLSRVLACSPLVLWFPMHTPSWPASFDIITIHTRYLSSCRFIQTITSIRI